MTKDKFLELKNKHSYKNQYKVKRADELKELVKLAESIDVKMDLNWLDVSHIQNMCCLFQNSKFDGDISKWNTKNVREMNYMFKDSNFTGDISKWDVHNVRNMDYMFDNTAFDGDLYKWNFAKLKSAKEFNWFLNIGDKNSLENYISFLKAIHENKPIKVSIEKDWLKTKNLPLYIANRMNNDKNFVEDIKRVIC